MTTNVMTIVKPWIKIGLESLTLAILGNPFTYRFFCESPTYAIVVVGAVPVYYPATPESHILEKVKPP